MFGHTQPSVPGTFMVLAFIILHHRKHLIPRHLRQLVALFPFLLCKVGMDESYPFAMESLIPWISWVHTDKALASSIWDIVNPQHMDWSFVVVLGFIILGAEGSCHRMSFLPGTSLSSQTRQGTLPWSSGHLDSAVWDVSSSTWNNK